MLYLCCIIQVVVKNLSTESSRKKLCIFIIFCITPKSFKKIKSSLNFYIYFFLNILIKLHTAVWQKSVLLNYKTFQCLMFFAILSSYTIVQNANYKKNNLIL